MLDPNSAARPTVESCSAEWLTIAEFRRLMRVSRTQAYTLIRRGDVPFVRLGRLIRVHCTAIKPNRSSSDSAPVSVGVTAAQVAPLGPGDATESVGAGE
jgi:excisionase family DNA binding protein